MKNQKLSRNTFIRIGVLLLLVQSLTAGTMHRVLNLSKRPLVPSRPSLITFDVPGAVNGTFPVAINPAGVITGYFNDENFASHGFVRTNRGIINTFDVPGAVNGTFPLAISSAGVVVGNFADEDLVAHGFLRAQNGIITTFDVPDASGGFFFPSGINPAGMIIGTWFDLNFVPHGFVRDSDGNVTSIDVPDAANGTQLIAISPDGVIAGIYTDEIFLGHGFLRASDGTITSFDPPPPGSIHAFAGFSLGPLLSITPEGVIAGTYFEPIPGNPFGGNFRAFVRATDGTFTTFDAASYDPCCIWSFPTGINPTETITGSFNDGFSVNHGFVRTRDGDIITFDIPGAGTGFVQGTAPLGITPGGVIMGRYIDADYGSHGFVRMP